jgi:serine/threonine protein kinase
MEIDILQHLSKIDDPSNHTISGTRVWQHQSGYMIYMPSGGGHLTILKQPEVHLWSTAKQLVEAVAFMHKHGVAHMDIKPPNVLIPVHGGRLSIIDFSTAVFVKNAKARFSGIVGTRGYLAPEVASGQGTYNPIHADLWSCGKTLEEFCLLCTPSEDTKALLDIAQRLMHAIPVERPSMSDVLTWMSDLDSLPGM